MARVRSPNFPVIGLGKAITRAKQVFEREQQLLAPVEVISKHLGYSGYNGKSAKVISALRKYGLLEASGSKLKVSQRAMRILFPRSDEDKQSAINEAAWSPALFRDILQEWEGGVPSDESLANFLIHRGFAQSAISTATAAYKDTISLVTPGQGQYKGAVGDDADDEDEADDMHLTAAETVTTGAAQARVLNKGGEPFKVQLVKGGIQGSFDIRNKEDFDDFLAGLEALKSLIPAGNA